MFYAKIDSTLQRSSKKIGKGNHDEFTGKEAVNSTSRYVSGARPRCGRGRISSVL